MPLTFEASMACFGVLPLGGDESVWLVRGVRPLATDAFLVCMAEVWLTLKTDELVLVRELAEPVTRRVSPASECCISSESGER